MFKVIETDTYREKIMEWSSDYIESAKKIANNLTENPYVGKELGYPFLREKRIKEKRIYYLIYEDLNLILLVAASGKKDQQKTIDFIKKGLDEFKEVAIEIFKQLS